MANQYPQLHITAGLGSIDDFLSYQGADEVFVGYVPERWMLKYGRALPLNRREVIYYNVQIGSMSELLILRDMAIKTGKKIVIAMNSLCYRLEDVKQSEIFCDIEDIVRELMDQGFDTFIMADLRLIRYLSERVEGIKIHLSGEYGELNHDVLTALSGTKITRIIFPRQTTIHEMEAMIKLHPEYEYEAFALNEKCHFTGAYCNSFHGDEMCHMCKLSYRFTDGVQVVNVEEETVDERGLGATGCGLCALYKLQKAGVSFLKIVGRGNESELMMRDVKAMKEATLLLNVANDESEYIHLLKAKFFNDGCSGRCYYKD